MSAGRGRVVKADRVVAERTPVPWEPRASIDDAPAAAVEVVRERGVVVGITVRCGCGRVHELELLPAADEEKS